MSARGSFISDIKEIRRRPRQHLTERFNQLGGRPDPTRVLLVSHEGRPTLEK